MRGQGDVLLATILVIEDDPVVLDSTIAILDGMGHRSLGTTTLASGLVSAKANHPEAVLMDVHLPDGDGSCAIKELRAIDPLMGVILFTGDLELHTATKAMESGAFEFLTKPFSYQSLQLAVNEVLRSRNTAGSRKGSGGDTAASAPREGAVASRRLLGATSEICRANLLIERFAKTPNTPILIMGESGTGKELCAAAIHMLSERSSGPFVKINCPAIPRSLIESELFGFEKGSFTDAKTSRPGVFEQADGGTLFLDEVGELDLDLQPKLLRVLEEKVVYRIGSRLPRPVNVRVVSATNRNIPEYCREGRFREDLYFRLAVLQITLPPLRERVPDIPLLAEHLLRDRSQAVGRYFTSLSPEVMEFLVEYRWPGNVRELKNFIERLVILSPQQGVLHMSRDELSRHTFLPHVARYGAKTRSNRIAQPSGASVTLFPAGPASPLP